MPICDRCGFTFGEVPRRWYTGIPPIDDVAAHERDNPGPVTRTDGIRLGRITVSREENPGGEYVNVDNQGKLCLLDRDRSLFALLLELSQASYACGWSMARF